MPTQVNFWVGVMWFRSQNSETRQEDKQSVQCKGHTVTPVAKQLLEKALGLSGPEREALAASLFESLEPDQDAATVQAEWNDEISKRIEELDSGKVATIPWSVARRMIRGEQIDDAAGN